MLLLFGLAVLIVFAAFHTPEFKAVLEMSQQELNETELKTWMAVGMFFGASIMLCALYLLMDYIMVILTVFITFGSTVSVSLVI